MIGTGAICRTSRGAGDGNSAYAFAYNGDGLVTSVDNNGRPNMRHVVLSQGYDLVGDMTSQSATVNGTADFANSYVFDNDQQLAMVQQQGVNGGNIVSPKEFDYAYNAVGQFTGMADHNFIGIGPRLDTLAGTFSYDTDARLTGIDYTSEGGENAVNNYGWSYNAGNLVTSFTTSTGTADYAYDPNSQLISATYSGTNQPANESYSFGGAFKGTGPIIERGLADGILGPCQEPHDLAISTGFETNTGAERGTFWFFSRGRKGDILVFLGQKGGRSGFSRVSGDPLLRWQPCHALPALLSVGSATTF